MGGEIPPQGVIEQVKHSFRAYDRGVCRDFGSDSQGLSCASKPLVYVIFMVLRRILPIGSRLKLSRAIWR